MAQHIEQVSFSASDFPTSAHYPFNLDVVRHTPSLSFDSAVTIFVGENGTGKSTFLEAMARACGIHIWRSEHGARYRYNAHEKTLHRHLRISWSDGRVPGAFFGSEHFKDFTHQLEDWASTDPGQLKYFGGASLVTQSHGQSMMAYFRSRYAIKGLYLLDEPETALSPRSQLDLLDIISENSRGGHAQFIITTHSPILLTCADARIYSFDHVPPEALNTMRLSIFGCIRNSWRITERISVAIRKPLHYKDQMNTHDFLNLTGRHVIVTGASRGIGYGIARMLALHGADVACAALHEEGAVKAAVRISSETGGKAIGLGMDVRSDESVKAAFSRIREEFVTLDIIVNNAGVANSVDFADLDEAAWDRVMDTNLKGCYRCCRAALP